MHVRFSWCHLFLVFCNHRVWQSFKGTVEDFMPCNIKSLMYVRGFKWIEVATTG